MIRDEGSDTMQEAMDYLNNTSLSSPEQPNAI